VAEEVLKLDQEAGQVEQAATGLEVDEEVDVAGGIGFAARHRPKHPDVAGAVAGGRGQDLGPHAGELPHRRTSCLRVDLLGHGERPPPSR
jgi:hypothetical protein